MEYSSREINQLLKQYEMFSSSLKIIKDEEEQKNICFQMTKLIEKIFELTNDIYEEKYNLLINSPTFLMEEEKNKLNDLILLIENREKYLNNMIKNYQQVTNEMLKMPNILGEDEIDTYKKTIKIIDIYTSNAEKINLYSKEINSINKTLTEAVKRIKYNDNLNKNLEIKMINLLKKSLEKLDLFKLLDSKEEIEEIYAKLNFAYKTAKDNVLMAKENNDERLIIECDAMLSKVALEFEEYKEKKSIIELINVYEDSVTNYVELIRKRNLINDILRNINNSELYALINEELEKQYKTIRLESQDIKTYDSLMKEKEARNKVLFELEEENNSEEFMTYLKDLIENEKKYKEQLMLEQRRKEYEENQRRLIEDKRLQEERIKRQKLIDEERKKEQEKRYRQLFNEQSKSSLGKEIIKEPENIQMAKEQIVAKPIKEEISEKIESAVVEEKNVFENILEDIEKKIKEEKANEEIKVSEKKDVSEVITEKKNSQVSEIIPVIKNNNLKAEVIDNKEILVTPEVTASLSFPDIEKKDEEKVSLSGNMGDFKFKNWFN